MQKGLVGDDITPLACARLTHVFLRSQHVPKHNSMVDKLQDPEFESKYEDEVKKHAEQSAAWIQQGMKEDAGKK